MWSISQTMMPASERARAWFARRPRYALHFHPHESTVPSGVFTVGRGGGEPSPEIDSSDETDFALWSQSQTVIDAKTWRAMVPSDCGLGEHEIDSLGGDLQSKWIAAETKTPLADYGHETFGGVTEYEQAWVTDGVTERVLLHVDSFHGTEERILPPLPYRGKKVELPDFLLSKAGPPGPIPQIQEKRKPFGVLELCSDGSSVRHYGISVLSCLFNIWGGHHRGFFAPHMRSFDSEKCRVR